MKIKLKSNAKVPIPNVQFSNAEAGAEIEYEFDNKLLDDENVARAKEILDKAVKASQATTSETVTELVRKSLDISKEALEAAASITPTGENDRYSGRKF